MGRLMFEWTLELFDRDGQSFSVEQRVVFLFLIGLLSLSPSSHYLSLGESSLYSETNWETLLKWCRGYGGSTGSTTTMCPLPAWHCLPSRLPRVGLCKSSQHHLQFPFHFENWLEVEINQYQFLIHTIMRPIIGQTKQQIYYCYNFQGPATVYGCNLWESRPHPRVSDRDVHILHCLLHCLPFLLCQHLRGLDYNHVPRAGRGGTARSWDR